MATLHLGSFVLFHLFSYMCLSPPFPTFSVSATPSCLCCLVGTSSSALRNMACWRTAVALSTATCPISKRIWRSVNICSAQLLSSLLFDINSLRTFPFVLHFWEQEKKPQYLIAVPRLYESLHKSILSTFQAQSKVKRGIVNAATAVSAGYTQARDVAKGLVVADKQPSVVAKVKYIGSCLRVFL